jgi:glycerol kinase
MFHTGRTLITPKTNLLTTYAYGIAGIRKYALEAPISGLGAEWDSKTPRGCSALKRAAFLVHDALRLAEKDANCQAGTLHADGEACTSDFLLQFQADILGIPVVRPIIKAVSALGNIHIAGVFTGYYKGRDAIVPFWKAEKIFEPSLKSSARNQLIEEWQQQK